MASLSLDPVSGFYRILYRYGGKQSHKSLKTTDRKEAESIKGRIEETLLAMERGFVALPPNADLWQFLLSNGKRDNKVVVADVLTLEKLFDAYVDRMPAGTMESNTLKTHNLHRKHLLRILKGKRAVQSLTATDMQAYANTRAKESHHGKLIQSATIQKETKTLGKVWKWAVSHGLLVGPSPTPGLMYEKGEAFPPFMTMTEIEDLIERGGMTEKQITEMWGNVFLDLQQTNELLEFVKEQVAAPFVYPMFVFVARTGARRSEILRSQIQDIDFVGGQVCIREKKRDNSVKFTFRHVDMSPMLREVMKEWIEKGHPGGPHTFCHHDVVPRSPKRSKTTGHKGEKSRATTLKGRTADVRERTETPGREPLTKDEATHAFKKTLKGSKWAVVPGFHVFRHSLASNAAAAGTRQEIIDGWLGHQTEDMRRRYRHLFPKEKRDAMQRVFGD